MHFEMVQLQGLIGWRGRCHKGAGCEDCCFGYAISIRWGHWRWQHAFNPLEEASSNSPGRLLAKE
jgi:hypothetical protein